MVLGLTGDELMRKPAVVDSNVVNTRLTGVCVREGGSSGANDGISSVETVDEEGVGAGVATRGAVAEGNSEEIDGGVEATDVITTPE